MRSAEQRREEFNDSQTWRRSLTLRDDLSLGAASFARAEDAPAQRVSRSEIWHNGPIKFVDTTPFKKAPPYTIGFSNASISNIWAVGYLHALQHGPNSTKTLSSR